MQFAAESPVSRLLITGASGFLGWHLCREALTRWEVHGTFHTHPLELGGVHLHRIDLAQKTAVQQWLWQLRPSAIIHTAALSKPNVCEQNPDRSYAANVEATGNLIDFCARQQIPFVFTSTEQVFDGQAAPYQETDVPSPINVYGRHKIEAERLIQQLHPQAVICRMPLLYGPPAPVADSFVQAFIRTLASQKPLSLFVDEYRSPAYVADAAAGLLLALEKGSGILHLGGPERISRYQFGQVLAEIFDLDSTLLSPCHQADVPMPATRPADLTSLNHKAVAIGYRPRTVRAGLMALKQAMHG